MRLVFAGTPVFAQTALAALHAGGHDIALVLTQPDRPAGRGMQLQASAVKQYAMQHGMALCQPTSLRLDGKYPDEAAAAQAAIAQAQAEAMVVVDQLFGPAPGQGPRSLSYELIPKFNAPIVLVSTIYPGASPSEVENSLTKPIEDAISGVEKIVSIRSTSFEGLSSVVVEFKDGINTDVALQDVQLA
jgi:hypothetical protein